MGELIVRALGAPEVHLGATRIDRDLPAKGVGLIVALADAGGPVARSLLAGRLWSDFPEEQARRSLRVTLSRMRPVLGDRLASDRTTVWLEGDVRYDVERVAGGPALDGEQPNALPFLDGFEPAGAELFNEWASQRRLELRRVAAEAHRRAIDAARLANDWDRTAELADGLITIEPWDEEAHRWLIDALARTAGPAVALDRAARFVEQLAHHIRVEPEAETVDLVAAIRAQTIERATPPPPEEGRAPSSVDAPFFGRQSELARLDELVAAGRPVTVVGPGGIGKTRLLTEFERRRVARGSDVVHVSFVGYAETSGPATERAFVEAVANALGLVVDAEQPLMTTVVRGIGDRHLLLGLDNVENLDGIERPLAELARSCPGLQIVLTSRRRLLLTTGRVLDLRGLDRDADDPTRPSPALALFLDRLPRAVGTARERHLAATAVGLVEGHPLAIELAAQWAALASLDQLVELLETPLELRSAAAGFAPRHRSLEGLIDAMSERLDAQCQALLAAASIFAGSFSVEELAVVSGQDATCLRTLVEHSLVSLSADGYSLHPIVRHHGALELERSGALADCRERHAVLMLGLLADVANPGADPDGAGPGVEDLRRAAEWFIDHGDADGLVAGLRPYFAHQRSRGWVESCLDTVERALARPDLSGATRAELRRHAAEAHLHAGDIAASRGALEAGLSEIGHPLPDRGIERLRTSVVDVAALAARSMRFGRAVDTDVAAEQARLMGMLSELLYVTDRRAEMASCGLGALVAGRRSGDPTLIGAGDATIAITAQLAGAHRLSERYRRQARRRLLRADAEPFSASLARAVTALVAAGRGNWHDARVDMEAAAQACRAAGRTRSLSQVELLGALVSYHEGRFDDAVDRLDEAERRITATGFRRAMTWVHASRAELALRRGDRDAAAVEADAALSVASSDALEDIARAHVTLARCRLDDRGEALAHLRAARPGLARGSATAFQHFETHCGYADAAVALEGAGAADAEVADDAIVVARRYAKAFPAARSRCADAVARRRSASPD